jgi:methyl-accepting chemotaxis protein
MDRGFTTDEGHDKTGRFIPYWYRSTDGPEILVRPLKGYEEGGTGLYYHLPKSIKQEVIIEPFSIDILGESILITSLVAPIMFENRFYGIIGIDLRIDTLQKLVDDVESLYGGSAKIRVISHNGILAAVTGEPEMAGKHLSDIETDALNDLRIISHGDEIVEIRKDQLNLFTPLRIGRITTPWSVNIIIPMDVITKAADQQAKAMVRDMWKMIGIGALCTIIALAIVWQGGRITLMPLKGLMEGVKHISDGNLEFRIHVQSNDELGKLGNSFNAMSDNLLKVNNERKHLIEELRQKAFFLPI